MAVPLLKGLCWLQQDWGVSGCKVSHFHTLRTSYLVSPLINALHPKQGHVLHLSLPKETWV